jgi:hypothetical protein
MGRGPLKKGVWNWFWGKQGQDGRIHKVLGVGGGAAGGGVDVVEKQFSDFSALRGWEMAELFEWVADVFEEQGIQLVPVLGATDSALYLPYIDGQRLSSVLKGLSSETQWRFRGEFVETTRELHGRLLWRARGWLMGKGYGPESQVGDWGGADVYHTT